MGNETSKLPGAIPQEKLDQIRNGDLSNEEIKELIYQGFDEHTKGKKTSRKKMSSLSDKLDQAETTGQPKRDSMKAAPFGRSRTDSHVHGRHDAKKVPSLSRCKTDGSSPMGGSSRRDHLFAKPMSRSTDFNSAEMTDSSKSRRRKSRKDNARAPTLKRCHTISSGSERLPFSLRTIGSTASHDRTGEQGFSSSHLDMSEHQPASFKQARMNKRTSLRKSISNDGSNRFPGKEVERNPQQVIHLLERFSTMDANLAEAYFKSLQKTSHDTAESSTNSVPKAA